jgi:hypothetical protein
VIGFLLVIVLLRLLIRRTWIADANLVGRQALAAALVAFHSQI